MGYQRWRFMLYLNKTRHGVFKYRRAIPPQLREAADSRKEFNRSLETRDPNDAKKLWALVHQEFESYLSDLEAFAKAPEGKAPIGFTAANWSGLSQASRANLHAPG